MIDVKLIYDKDCPNVAATRANLLRAFAEVRLPARWTEWDRAAPATPARFHRFGSPAILIDAQDIQGITQGEGQANCRLYELPDGGRSGVPPTEMIAAVLAGAQLRSMTAGKQTSGSWRHSMFALPGIGVSLLPALAPPDSSS